MTLDPMVVAHEFMPKFEMATHGAHRRFAVGSPTTAACRRSANDLLLRRYGWRGYQSVSLPHPDSSRHLPLTATQDGVVIGTITVGIDGPERLNCDRAFSAEINEMRSAGRRLCEFTKLAIDEAFGSKHVLAALFHLAYLAADRMAKVDTLLMEVNPRHVRYYSRMLGATVVGSERINHTVNAPAVLLSMKFADVRGKIDEIAGSPRRTSGQRSLYSLAFNQREEQAILARLTSRQVGIGTALGFSLPASQTASASEH